MLHYKVVYDLVLCLITFHHTAAHNNLHHDIAKHHGLAYVDILYHIEEKNTSLMIQDTLSTQ